MSYAGKSVRGRRGALHARTTGTRGSATAPARRAGRDLPLATRPRSDVVTESSALDTEVDWQRVAIFATGAALGALVGAGATLLFAPQSGAETRRDLARHGRRLRHRTTDAWDDLRDELQWAARRGRRRVGHLLRGRREARADHEEQLGGV